MEQLYLPHTKTFGKMKTKTFDQEDWQYVFPALEALLRNCRKSIIRGWQCTAFTSLFSKLLKNDNHPYIRLQCFRCLVFYTDAAAIKHGFEGTHIDLLRSVIDFSPFSGANVELPKRKGGYIEGWSRTGAPAPDEPVNMLKFLLDYSVEPMLAKDVQAAGSEAKYSGPNGRFEFWCEVAMKIYFPLLYPQVCSKVGFKAADDNFGFFHHCPGSFQRLVARWIYKLKSLNGCMELVWKNPAYVDVIMEALRQRFLYRDAELAIDAIKLYDGWCEGSQYVPRGMKAQMPQIQLNSIVHVALLFQNSSTFEDKKYAEIIEIAAGYLETLAKSNLDPETLAILRTTVVNIIDKSFASKDSPPFTLNLSKFLRVAFHVWMYGVTSDDGFEDSVWNELETALTRWLKMNEKRNLIGTEIIDRWKEELIHLSHLTMLRLDPSMDTELFSRSGDITNDDDEDSSDMKTKERPSQHERPSQEIAEQCDVDGPQEAVLLLDRVLHLLPAKAVEKLDPKLHLLLIKAIGQVISVWIYSAIVPETTAINERNVNLPGRASAILSRISPSSLVSIFGKYFLPACYSTASEYKESRIKAITILCTTCTIRCETELSSDDAARLCEVILSGLRTKDVKIISTIMRHGSRVFNSDIPGINILLPSFIQAVPDIMRLSSLTQSDLKGILGVVFSMIGFISRYRGISMTSWDDHMKYAVSSQLNGSAATKLKEIHQDGLYLVTETLDPVGGIGQLLGRLLRKILDTKLKGSAVKQMCLWGLYNLIVTELTNPTEATAGLLKNWIAAICEVCKTDSGKIAHTALQLISTLADHSDLIDSSLVHQVVMTLALLAQQEIEGASVEVQDIIEAATDKASVDVTKLNLMAAKIGQIFDTMRTWLMRGTFTSEVVNQTVFNAIEAALIGILPEGSWQDKILKEKTKKGEHSTPLLFLGLKMRVSLEKEEYHTVVQAFEHMAAAAQALLLHLLHHFHNFPTAVAEQMGSSSSEFTFGHDDYNIMRFLYMDSMIFTVVESASSSTARIILRDQSGSYTWDTKATNPSPKDGFFNARKRGEAWYAEASKGVTQPSTLHTFRRAHQRAVITGRKVRNRSSTGRKKGTSDVLVSVKLQSRKSDFNGLATDQVFHAESSDSSEGGDEDGGSRSGGKKVNDVAGIFEMSKTQKGVGNLDGESSLLDLFLDSMSMKFSDVTGELTDRTLLGGRYTLQRYEMNDERELAVHEKFDTGASGDSLLRKGLAFSQRLCHDEEAYTKFKQFVLKQKPSSDEDLTKLKNIFEFCDAVRRYSRSKTRDSRHASSSVIYWDFFSKEGRRYIKFPVKISTEILNRMQQQYTYDDLFDQAMEYIDDFLMESHIPDFFGAIDVPEQVIGFDEVDVMEQNMFNYVVGLERLSKALVTPREPEELPSPASRIAPLDQSRLFLAQLDCFFPSVGSTGATNIRLLQAGPKMTRSLKNLDKTSSRETMKIGVIYVAPGQTNQSEILRNSTASSTFNSFLQGLGWEVDLVSHKGFSGGLDCNPKSLSNGASTFYYADSSTEMIYHILTKMPTKSGDPQQIDKKRHVGNDFVHIVWSENHRDYLPTTISSNFNDVQIVIHPFARSHQGMYRIQIYSKPEIPVFGPLLSGMVVNRTSLASLVRQTAMNANRLCRQKTAIYQPPYATRSKLIDEIKDRYAVTYDDRELLLNLYDRTGDDEK